MRRFYISTTIPYVNGDPHIGHALEYIQTDAVARYRRLFRDDVFFLSGTDENSLKNVQAAEKAGKPVKEFVDEKAANFLRFRETLNISFDDFIRTTEARHVDGAQKFWKACKKDDIYKKTYRGLYCVGCEAFYADNELQNGLCPEHKAAPDIVEEENYFFRLSRYQKEIADILKYDVIKIYPAHRKNEMLALLERGLADFSISRSVERAHSWGVPVPGDDTQIMYVWFDALTNYITALGYADDQKLFKKYWEQARQKPRRVAHVLGKGVARFHLVYWIGMLLSAGVKLPTEEFVHGYITVNNEKMSKSLGNVINPHDVVATYGTDPVRYFFLSAVSPAQDGDFSHERFREVYTAELANGVGNLASRVCTMVEKYAHGKAPAKANDLFETERFWKAYHAAFRSYQFDEVARQIQSLVSRADETISAQKPWEKAKASGDVSVLLYQLAETLRHIGLALLPVVPSAAEKLLFHLGVNPNKLGTLEKEARWGGLKKGSIIKKGESLFPRL